MPKTHEEVVESIVEGIADNDVAHEYVREEVCKKLGLQPDDGDNKEYWKEYSIILDELVAEARKKLLPFITINPFD
jgi:hypothetical protein